MDWENSVVTSIKSLDLGAKTYQNLSTLARTVQGYIDKLANFRGVPTGWGKAVIRSTDITARELLLAIPPGATEAQLAVLQRLQQQASDVDVILLIVTVPW